MNQFKRTTLFHIKKYQRVFFYPVVAAFVLGCIVSWLSLVYFLIGNYFFDDGLYKFQDAIPALLACAAIVMMLVIFWTVQISSSYIGSYERICNELDGALAGKKGARIEVRKNDKIFNELLKRIDVLLQKNQ